MENIITETEWIHDHLFLVKYIDKCSTCARLNVYGLKNSYTLGKHLIAKFRTRQGIYNIKPNTSTGNILIKFDAQKTNHKEIFSILYATVANFLKDEFYTVNNEVISHSLAQSNQSFYLYSEEGTSNKDIQDCKPYSNSQSVSIVRKVIFNKATSIMLKTAGIFLLQHFTKKVAQHSLSRLGI